MICFTPAVALNARPRRWAICSSQTPRIMAQFSMDDDYIRQLSKNSKEQARRLAQNLDDAALSESRHQSPARGVNNSSDEHVEQLARNRDLMRRRSEAFAEARRRQRQSMQNNAGEQQPLKSSSSNNGARERALAELDRLNKEAEELQNLVERQRKQDEEAADGEVAEEVEHIPAAQIERDIFAIEAQLLAAERPSANLLDDQIAEIKAKLAERQRSAVEPRISAYAELREKMDRSVAADEDKDEGDDGFATRFVEDERTETEAREETSGLDELSRMRRGMVEFRLESERYARARRELREKHEQMTNIIIENYMPGL